MHKLTLTLLILFANINFIQAEPIEAQILRSIHTERNASLDNFMKLTSNSTFVILPAVPLGLFAGSLVKNDEQQKWNSIDIAGSVVIAGATSFLIKQIFTRPRPFEKYNFIKNVGEEDGYSFPSSHSATSFALATSLSLAYPKWYVIIPSYLWASLVAYSRMHLGVHYFTDVIVGALLGTGVSFATQAVIKEIRK